MLNNNEIAILIEDVSILCANYINEHIKEMSSPDFDNNIFQNIIDLLIIQMPFMVTDKQIDKLKNIVRYILDHYCYIYIIPKRSHFVTKPRELTCEQKERIKKQIYYLTNVKQPEQRTDEWYAFRRNYITASNAWKCMGSESQRNSIICEKCKAPEKKPDDEPEQTTFVNTETTLHFGNKYEPISVLYYEFIYKTRVGEFGCIPHTEHKFLAASPDGINIDETSKYYGYMLEIKNIVNREITGNPKLEYWVQMQLQMETCNLNNCHFLETRFVEYETEEDFENDGTFNKSFDDKYKGIILYFIDNMKPLYEYAPFNATYDEYKEWETQMFEKHSNLTWLKNIYWRLEEVSCVHVIRNRKWFNSIVSDIEDVWNTVQKERVTGYEHRKPRKNNKLKPPIQEVKSDRKCLINTTQLFEE